MEDFVLIDNIKEEEPVHFELILPPFSPNKRLLGDIDIGDEVLSDTKKDKKLENHLKRSKPHYCDLCGKICQSRERMYEHILAHIKRFKCQCGKGFATKGHLKEHMTIHDENRQSYACHLCPATYTWKTNLEKHVKEVHFSSEERFYCDKCEYVGKAKRNLVQHQYIHNRAFRCTERLCGMRFNTEHLLKKHLKKHETPKGKFVCPCSRVFRSLVALNTHKTKVHKNEHQINLFDGNYECGICNKKFKLKGTLKRHLKTHEENVTCPICSKIIAATTLIHHIRYHKTKKSEKRFKCHRCPAAFHTNQNFNRHLKIHSKSASQS